MSDVYQLQTAGSPPVSLADMKAHLKITNDAEDSMLLAWITSAMQHGQARTGREFTANLWTLFKDTFETRTCLDRSPVNTVVSVSRLVSDALTAVSSDVYYLKLGVQASEILLNDGEEWPDDVDEREQAIQISFVTQEYDRFAEQIRSGMMNHVSAMYANRGDCEGPGGEAGRINAADTSGANALYDQFTVARF